jgi:ABC-type multidrug transport system fused ATPase/permease subunit
MLKEIFKENAARISFTYFITISEFVIYSFIPYITGLAIDDLITGNKRMLYVHGTILAFSIIVGGFRRAYDTRVFSDIYIKKASKTIKTLREKQFDEKKLVSRYGLVGIYSDFFEFTLPLAVRVFINISMAVIMISLIEYRILLFILPILCIVIYAQKITSKKTQKIEYTMQDTRENISKNLVENQCCNAELEKQKISLIKKSDIESVTWMFCDVLWSSAEIISIIIICSFGLSMGEITSILLYFTKIIMHTDMTFSLFSQIRLLEMTNDLLDCEIK